MAIDTRDLIDIHMLLARYGHVIDDRDWDAFDTVFTEDIEYDATDFGLGVMRGIPEIVDRWKPPFDHPLAHHTTNIEVTEDADGTVRARAKHLGVRQTSAVFMNYEDVLRKTDAGWRIARRAARLRHRMTFPGA